MQFIKCEYNSFRISELIDSYHHLAVREKADQEWSKFVRKRNYMILLERYPVLNPRLRRYCSSSWTTPVRENEPAKKVVIPAANASSEPDEFCLDEFIKNPLCIDKVTNIRQRHLAPQIQSKTTTILEPRPKSLVIKRSMRCRVCEHNLSKADFNPSSIKFRINLSAIYHVPELRYMISPVTKVDKINKTDCKSQRRTSTTMAAMKDEPIVHPNVIPGQTMNIILTISNPAHRVTTISLRQLTLEEEQEHLGHLIEKYQKDEELFTDFTHVHKPQLKDEQQHDSEHSSVDSAGDKANSADKPQIGYSTVKLSLPCTELKLAPRNDIADYDENVNQNALANVKDDRKVVAFRRGNKLGINVGLIPRSDVKLKYSKPSSLSSINEGCANDTITDDNNDDDKGHKSGRLFPLRAAIYLNFDYKNTTTTLLSEQRAAAAAAVAGAVSAARKNSSDIKNVATIPEKSVSKISNDSIETQNSDELNQIQLIVLFNFGNILV